MLFEKSLLPRRKIAMKHGSKEADKIVTVLEGLGFNIQLLGSVTYVQGKLEKLVDDELQKIRLIFFRTKHPKFFSVFKSGSPYGRWEEFHQLIQDADLGKLTQLIKAAAMLLQTKVYLFWETR